MKSTMVQQYAKAGKGEKPAESESREISKRKLTLDELQEHNSLNQKAGEGKKPDELKQNCNQINPKILTTTTKIQKLTIQTLTM